MGIGLLISATAFAAQTCAWFLPIAVQNRQAQHDGSHGFRAGRSRRQRLSERDDSSLVFPLLYFNDLARLAEPELFKRNSADYYFAFYSLVEEIVSMIGIFVSYRREDSSGYAGRLFDSLHPHLGRDRIYMDVVTNEPGIDFVKTIEAALKACRVLIVLIGKKWVNLTDASGRRRLDNPDDFVRLEVAAAIKRRARIIPVLVEGATMPNASELPPELKRLTRFQALEISDSRWDHDLGRLVEILKKIGKRSRALPMMAGFVFTAIILVLGLYQVEILSNHSIVLPFNLTSKIDSLLEKLKKKYSIILPAGAQAKAGPGTHKILAAQPDQYSAEKLTLSFKMHYTRDNSWSEGALTGEQFRLIVDNEQATSEI